MGMPLSARHQAAEAQHAQPGRKPCRCSQQIFWQWIMCLHMSTRSRALGAMRDLWAARARLAPPRARLPKFPWGQHLVLRTQPGSLQLLLRLWVGGRQRCPHDGALDRMTERLTGEHRSAYAGTGPAAEGTPAVRPAMQAGPGSRIPGLERIPGHAPGLLALDRDAERSTGERRLDSAGRGPGRRPEGCLPSHTCGAGWAGRTNPERRDARAMRHGQRAAEADPGLSASEEAPTSAACACERRSLATKVPQRVLGPWTAVRG